MAAGHRLVPNPKADRPSPENPARVHLAPRSKSRRLRTAGFATGEHPFGKAAVASCTALCATHKTFRNRNGLMATGNHWVTAETCFRIRQARCERRGMIRCRVAAGWVRRGAVQAPSASWATSNTTPASEATVLITKETSSREKTLPRP